MTILTRAFTTFLLSATLATTTAAEPPSTAFLRWNTNDAELAAYAHDKLTQCLAERGALRVIDAKTTHAKVDELGIDIARVMGISDDENRRIGQALDTDYVMSGAFSVLKSLTFSGWRRDISADVRLHRSSDGSEVGYWQTTTGFSFVSSNTALDAKAMSDRATGEFCAEITKAAASGFVKEKEPASESTGFGW